ncbi:ABC transporter ATP-binding protein [Paenibacillus sp. 32352]|uniref:ATP-binding cassette domain-containing protein n=1 Tax=Paenibacillus sp. 32352 TaxID=1969111 RepID=UPI0009AEA2CF|nr:ABC transporter ATP-binding protein [Paenibacillus sp. 32352]
MSSADANPVIIKPAADFVNLLLLPAQLLLLKWVIDGLSAWNGGTVQQDLIIASGWLAAVMLVQALIGRTSLLSHNRLNEIGQYEVERAVLEKNARLNLSLLESPSIQNLRTRALRASPEILFMNGYSYIQQLIQSVLLLSILAYFGQWAIVLFFLIALPIQLPLRSYAARKAERLQHQQIPERRRAHYLAQLMTSRIPAKEIRLLDLGSYFQASWMRLHTKSSKETVRQRIKEQLLQLPSELAVALVRAAMAAIVVLVAVQRGNTAGEVALLLQIAITLGGLWPGLLDLHASLKQQSLRWDELQQYLQLEEDKVHVPSYPSGGISEARAGSQRSAATAAALKVEWLTFTYEGRDTPALEDITFQAAAGEKMAIVGENGSGKSTLVKLLMGLYLPQSGSVEYYSQAGTLLSATEASGCFTAVLQDFTKMNLSVREQIAIGSIGRLHDDPALLAALRQANAHTWGLGLDERIGPEFGGRELSGGQWQSLAAGRAYIREGSILFFDEPTSALDPLAEKAAITDFLRIAGKRTAFLVTHRLGAARMADRILVLQNGRLIEQGTHDQLMTACGEYERLYRMQASWYQEGVVR